MAETGKSQLRNAIGDKFSLFVLVISCLFICTIVIMNIFLNDALFIRGVNFIYGYQKSQPYGAFHVIQNLISLLCNPIGVGVVLGLYYFLANRKLLLLVHLSYFLLATYIIAVLKQAFQQSRPIWYDSRINNWEWFCPKDFGNPSGHSFAVMLLYEPIISDSIGYGKFKLWVLPLLLIGVMVPVSRMYLGVHSANQILFGLSLGFIALALYKYVYQRALYNLYWKLLLGPFRILSLVVIVILNLITIGIPIIFYQVYLVTNPMLTKDITNLNEQCNTSLTGKEVQIHMLTACAIGCFGYGLTYGFILLANEEGYRRYLLGLWVHQTKPKILLKILVYVLCAGIPAGLFFLISSVAAKAALLKYFLNCIGAILGGFGLAYLAPKLTKKWKIMKFIDGSRGEEGYLENIEEKMEDNKEKLQAIPTTSELEDDKKREID